MKIRIVMITFFFLITFLMPRSLEVSASPPLSDPPAFPKTRSQIASEAYAIEASVRANAGRKTNPSNDGTGATTDFTFTSTADFDAGTKTSVETSTDTCNQRATGEFGLVSGNNYHGVSASCISGSKGISGGLSASYDFETLNSGNIKDFSGNVNDCGPAGGPVTSTGIYGGAYLMDGINDKFTCSAISTPISYTWHILTKPVAGSSDLIISMNTAGTNYLTWGLVTPGHFSCVYPGGLVADGGASPAGYWYYVDCVFNNANSTINIYLNGTWKAKTSTVLGLTWDQFHIGYFLTTLFYNGHIDELSVWTKVLTGAEILNLATDGRGQYFSGTGAWKSATQTATAETFKKIVISYSSVSVSNYITSVYLFDTNGAYFFIDNTNLTSGSTHTYTLTGNSAVGWKVGTNLTGNGIGTPLVSNIVITTTGGVGTFTGCAPNPSGMTCATNSTWDQSKVKLCGQQVFTIDSTASHVKLSLHVTNSKIDGCGLNGVFKTTDTTTSEVYLWDGVSGMTYDFSNSTLFNFTAATLHLNSGGNYRVGAQIVKLDNVTISNFDTFSRSNGAVERSYISSAHDSDVSSYNRDDDSWCALTQQAQNTSLGYSIDRIHFTISNAILTGCAAGNDLRRAKGNVFDGGFLQITFGADFEHGVSPDFGSSTEFVNWSSNYVNDSRHTVFGFYGTGTGAFGDHLGINAYGTIYHNYVNNSRYIPIQTAGNVSGVHVIGNYMRGPIPWPGGSPTFEIAILMGEQNHNSLVSGNYLWDMDDSHIVGIDVGFAAYDIMVSNNVLYDIGGNHIRIEGTILKFKNSGACSVGCSDYSWKGSNNTIRANYLSGGTASPAINLDSAGYTHFFSNVVSSAGTYTFLVRKSLNCDPNCAFTWADWIDGYPNEPSIQWSGTIPASNESQFWIRSIRTGTLQSSIIHSVWVNLTTANPTRFGLLSTRCVNDNAATGGHTTTDAEILAWSGHSCGPVSDQKNFHFVGTGFESYTVSHPETWYNKTTTLSFAPINAQISFIGPFTVTTTNTGGSYTASGSFSISPGYNYLISTDEKITKLMISGAWIFGFIALLTLGLVGAFAIKRKRGH